MGDILVILVLLAVAVLCIRSLVKGRKKGCGCSSCAGCAHSAACAHARTDHSN